MYFVDYNSNKFLFIIFDFIVGRFCFVVKFSLCVDIVVNRFGVIGQIYVGFVIEGFVNEGGIGLKKNKGCLVIYIRFGFLKLIKIWIFI